MRDETLIKQVQRSDFDSKDNLQLGMQYNAQTEDGRPFTVTIVDINGDTITIDGNHALAGKRLHYDVTVESVREANEGEISRGHVLR